MEMDEVAIEKTREKIYTGLDNSKIAIERILKEIAGDVDEIMFEMISDIESIELQEAAKHLVISGGKRARAVISLLSCEAVLGEPKFALPAAVSVEFIHTASLVHDDIVDNNVTRRGRESVHVRWGVPIGVSVGNLLLAMATKAMLDFAGHAAIQAPEEFTLTNMSKSAFYNASETLSMFSDAWVTLCQGKETDSLLKRERYVTQDEVIKMIYQKTGILYELAAKSGATAGNGSPEEIMGLKNYGGLMGIAFQIKDDILGLMADETEFGKHVGADIREGKKTVMVVHALNNGGDKNIILDALGNINATSNQILQSIDAIKDAGSIDYAKRLAKSLGEQGEKSLDVLVASEAKESLLNISNYLISGRNW